VEGETVYVGTLDQRLVALDLATGSERWSAELDGRIKSALVSADGTLVVLAEPHHLHGFRPLRAAGVAAR
jgi:outer membrane protein assembly factor BamB